MNRIVCSTLVGFLGFTALACQSRDLSFRELSYQTLSIAPSDREKGPLVPLELVEVIQGSTGSEPLMRRPFDLNIYIYQTGPGVLQENLRIQSALGWGELDLSTVLRSPTGSFHFLVDPDLTAQQVRQLKVLFVPEYGPEACSRVFDVTKQFQRQWRQGGFRLRVQDQQYLTSLGGQLVLFFVLDDQIHLAGFRVFDSRKAGSACPIRLDEEI